MQLLRRACVGHQSGRRHELLNCRQEGDGDVEGFQDVVEVSMHGVEAHDHLPTGTIVGGDDVAEQVNGRAPVLSGCGTVQPESHRSDVDASVRPCAALALQSSHM